VEFWNCDKNVFVLFKSPRQLYGALVLAGYVHMKASATLIDKKQVGFDEKMIILPI
jgi:hypothetical protein